MLMNTKELELFITENRSNDWEYWNIETIEVKE